MQFKPQQFSFGGVALLLALASIVSARPALAHDLPFRGRIDGRSFAAPTPSPFIYMGGADAAGEATHLGTFHKVTSDVIDISTGAIDGAFTMTVAHGDQLTGVYDGFFTLGATPGTSSWCWTPRSRAAPADSQMPREHSYLSRMFDTSSLMA